MAKKEQISKFGIDREKGIEYQYVKIANPVMLGMQVAIGMFVVFPLFILLIAFVLVLFGLSL